MNATQDRFAPDEELYKVIQYCRNHWCALTRFMTDGSTPMTDNLAERELGVIGRGRKAWLFAGATPRVTGSRSSTPSSEPVDGYRLRHSST